ncbi:PepSY domain-containing protein [Bacillus tuaregi]|uniref:PepSY domain-containing protein n=1 Tax=Bacillus tuaregi TaxID=1816695 RepID=UPI0008F8EE08|nr:PepSY domain-containing protein [Bacillus tuaregi]
MNRRLFLWIGCGAAVLIILIFVATQMTGPIFTKADMLTEQEAQAIAEDRYAGKVQKINQSNNDFVMELERNTGVYEIRINRESGEVTSLKRISQASESEGATNEKNDEATGEPLNPETPPVDEGSKRLTEQEAAAIALEQVAGNIDDVDYEKVNGMGFYFVDVETTDGREAKVEINAITGEVKSLTWDDDDDD